jgi:hypothetical protein
MSPFTGVCIPHEGERAAIEQFHNGALSLGPRTSKLASSGGQLVFPLGNTASVGGGDENGATRWVPLVLFLISRVRVWGIWKKNRKTLISASDFFAFSYHKTGSTPN